MKPQRIRDPIHDLISFSNKSDSFIWQLVQTEPMQRLRRVKQLGFSEFVYPGATHTRFSHSLGAMQMARRMLAAFERTDVFDVFSADHVKMKKATIAAALLHDVGHGPYSHVFEELCEDCDIGKSHEEWTSDLIQQTYIQNILKEEGLFEEVTSFFNTEKSHTPYTAIISSQLDCDRLDFCAEIVIFVVFVRRQLILNGYLIVSLLKTLLLTFEKAPNNFHLLFTLKGYV